MYRVRRAAYLANRVVEAPRTVRDLGGQEWSGFP